jgi:hypothetical protein
MGQGMSQDVVLGAKDRVLSSGKEHSCTVAVFGDSHCGKTALLNTVGRILGENVLLPMGDLSGSTTRYGRVVRIGGWTFVESPGFSLSLESTWGEYFERLHRGLPSQVDSSGLVECEAEPNPKERVNMCLFVLNGNDVVDVGWLTTGLRQSYVDNAKQLIRKIRNKFVMPLLVIVNGASNTFKSETMRMALMSALDCHSGQMQFVDVYTRMDEPRDLEMEYKVLCGLMYLNESRYL